MQGNCLVDLAECTQPPALLIAAELKKKAKDEKEENAEEGNGSLECVSVFGKGYAELHRNFKTWATVPPGWKRRLLDQAEEISLGMHATKLLIPRGGREPPSSSMDELLMCVTDLDLTREVGGTRDFASLSEYVNARNMVNGRPCERLKIEENTSTGINTALHQLKSTMVVYCCSSSQPLGNCT